MTNQEEAKNSNLDEALKLLLDSNEKDAEEELKKGLEMADSRVDKSKRATGMGIRG